MPNLKEIRSRINSVASTMQITAAMKMVSAAKLKKSQDAIIKMRPYSEKMNQILGQLTSSVDLSDIPGNLTQKGKGEKILFVVISSNRGLCGAFNSSLYKEVQKFIVEKNISVPVQFITVGRKAFDYYKKGSQLLANYTHLWEHPSFETVSRAADELIKLFQTNEFAEIYLVYNHFKNAANQLPVVEKFLPITLPEGKKTVGDYLFEPDKVEILTDLIPKTLRTQFFKAILDSTASEHGARMTAMHKATDNAEKLKHELVLNYNKARQAAITKEILEIVGGAEALEG